ncbi:hypothetical protein ACFL1I_01475 [Candidatus Omnitrophota bacterium]
MFNPNSRWDRPSFQPQNTAHQTIEVIARFGPGKIKPICFTLGNQRYDIKRVNFFWKDYQGREKLYCFSVTDGANTFQIYFSNRTLSWKLANTS